SHNPAYMCLLLSPCMLSRSAGDSPDIRPAAYQLLFFHISPVPHITLCKLILRFSFVHTHFPANAGKYTPVLLPYGSIRDILPDRRRDRRQYASAADLYFFFIDNFPIMGL